VGPLEERVRVAVRDEMALTLADAVLRRLDLGTAGAPAEADLERVIRAMGAELGWDAGQARSERAMLAAIYPSRPAREP
jgi:glycerol-3-phosphate dehydrogenase